MLGHDLLVAPVFSDDGDVSYYVPAGTWTHFLTGAHGRPARAGCARRHGFDSVPLLVRPGAVIPVGAVDDRPDYDYADGVTLRAYGLERGAQVTVPSASVIFTVVREGDTLRASCSDPAAPWGLAAAGHEVRAPGRDRVPDSGAGADGEDHRCGAARRGVPEHRVVRPQRQAPDLRGDPAARRGAASASWATGRTRAPGPWPAAGRTCWRWWCRCGPGSMCRSSCSSRCPW